MSTIHFDSWLMPLFWAPQIAVNHLIFSYFYFIDKQQISNFQHIICFCDDIGLLGMDGNAHNFAAVYHKKRSLHVLRKPRLVSSE